MKLSSLIDIHALKKSYVMGATIEYALQGVDLHVDSGELVAIMGPSGSGKSTLMNIIGLLDQPTSGSYRLNQQELSSIDEEERARLRNQFIGFVFQSFYLLPKLTALQNVGLPLRYRHAPLHEIERQSLAMLAKVDMAPNLAKHKPQELSGGQQQRVAIARALVGNPRIILADEPTGALDTKTGQEVMDLFIQLNRQDKVTIIIVTHDEKVSRQCNRILHIQDGKMI
jgi:putative ABC transport system ATP-binding protein